eukprot:jgi/Phyca11/507391/fgenesh2_kg.PHYCAscaffold_27_\
MLSSNTSRNWQKQQPLQPPLPRKRNKQALQHLVSQGNTTAKLKAAANRHRNETCVSVIIVYKKESLPDIPRQLLQAVNCPQMSLLEGHSLAPHGRV